MCVWILDVGPTFFQARGFESIFSTMRTICNSSYLNPATDQKQKALYQQYSFNDLWSASQLKCSLIRNVCTHRLHWESWSKRETWLVPHLKGNSTEDNQICLLFGENYACLRRMKYICNTDTMTKCDWWMWNHVDIGAKNTTRIVCSYAS